MIVKKRSLHINFHDCRLPIVFSLIVSYYWWDDQNCSGKFESEGHRKIKLFIKDEKNYPKSQGKNCFLNFVNSHVEFLKMECTFYNIPCRSTKDQSQEYHQGKLLLPYIQQAIMLEKILKEDKDRIVVDVFSMLHKKNARRKNM